jgi:hypothetical protein
MKIKFKKIMNRVPEEDREGLGQFHQRFGGEAALKLIALRQRFNTGGASGIGRRLERKTR